MGIQAGLVRLNCPFPCLTHDLKAELPGFKTQVSLGVILVQTQVARIDFVLTPGEIAEQVTVTGQSTVIDTDTAEVSSVIDEKKILDLPLRGRDLVKLAYLTTGGTQENQETGYTSLYSYGGGYPSFNGQYAHSNQVMLDGSNNMGYITQRPTVQATLETVQEFKVITSTTRPSTDEWVARHRTPYGTTGFLCSRSRCTRCLSSAKRSPSTSASICPTLSTMPSSMHRMGTLLPRA